MIPVPSLSTAKDALALLSQITDLTKAAMTIELKEKIIELRHAVVGLEENMLDLQKENFEIKKRLEIRNQLKFKRPNYYLQKENGIEDGPYCQVCQDKDDKLIRLQTIEEGSWTCRGCNQHFETEERHHRSMASVDEYNRRIRDESW